MDQMEVVQRLSLSLSLSSPSPSPLYLIYLHLPIVSPSDVPAAVSPSLSSFSVRVTICSWYIWCTYTPAVPLSLLLLQVYRQFLWFKASPHSLLQPLSLHPFCPKEDLLRSNSSSLAIREGWAGEEVAIQGA